MIQYLYKKINLIVLLAFVSVCMCKSDAHASNYDFSSYDPTLTSLYPGTENINSYYTMNFALGSSSSNDFVYYQLNADGTITTLYYQIEADENLSKVGSLLPRIPLPTAGQTAEGYFYGYTNRAITTNAIKMGNITADFVSNKMVSSTGHASGAVISSSAISNGSGGYNYGGTGIITGDFINNYVYTNATGTDASGTPFYAAGGTIYLNRNTLDGIKGNFVGNYSWSENGRSYGGAIHATNAPVEITFIDGSFIGNYTYSGTDTAVGGAINTTAKTDRISGVFVSNHATSASGETLPNPSNPQVPRVIEASGGAMFISSSANIGKIDASFYSNYAESAAKTLGGAIYHGSNNKTDISGNFIANYAKSSNSGNYYALGGAIYTQTNLSFSSTGESYSFTNNYTLDSRGKNYNSIFVYTGSVGRSLDFNVSNDGSITVNDGIIGANQNLGYNNTYDINIEGDNSGSVVFNANIINVGSVNVKNTTLELGSYDHKDNTATNSYGHGLFVPATGTDPVTSLSLDNADLVLNYDTYKELRLVNFTANNNSHLSFGATFGASGTGTSDSINADTTSGSINLRRIAMGAEASVGDSVNLFTGAAMGIDNIDSFSLLYQNYIYTFSHDGKILSIKTKSLGSDFPYYVEPLKTLNIEDTDFDNRSTKGIAVNDGELIVSESSFSNNSNLGNNYNSDGDGGVILNRTGGDLEILNSDFTNNVANGLGGAIYSAEDFIITADAHNSIFSGNEDKNGDNDIYMEDDTTLNLHVVNGGSIAFESGITGNGTYDIEITGDSDSTVILDAKAENAENVTVSGTNLKVGREDNLNNINLTLNNGIFDIANTDTGTIVLNNLTSNSGYIKIDVMPDTNTADMLDINGDMDGTVNLILNVLSTSRPTDNILFAHVDGNITQDSTFEIYRIIGSPYKWGTILDDSNNDWYLEVLGRPGQVELTSEVISYLGLHSASLEQTRSMVGNVRNKAAANKIACGRCGVYDEQYSASPLNNVWVNPIYHYSKIKNPVNIDADIWGLDAGYDKQIDRHNKFGFFVSYRSGNYDLNGDGKKYYSTVGSEIDIKSYIGGLYYRFDKRNDWVFATIYGGIQKADIKTEDGLKTDTDGVQLGASIEAGHIFDYAYNFTVEPSVGLYYTQIDFDKIHDVFGKTASYKTIHQAEIEAGVKFEKRWLYEAGHTKLYLKPSVVQVITMGDRLKVTGMNKRFNTDHDQTLGRIEIGARTALTKNLSSYGFVNYTLGSEYNSSSLGIGLSYSW